MYRPKDHVSIRILQTMFFGIPPVSWALEPKCRILRFMWPLGPVVQSWLQSGPNANPTCTALTRVACIKRRPAFSRALASLGEPSQKSRLPGTVQSQTQPSTVGPSRLTDHVVPCLYHSHIEIHTSKILQNESGLLRKQFHEAKGGAMPRGVTGGDRKAAVPFAVGGI